MKQIQANIWNRGAKRGGEERCSDGVYRDKKSDKLHCGWKKNILGERNEQKNLN